MSEPEEPNMCGDELDRQLRLFCYLMLGSADAAERVMRQIHQRALEFRDDPHDRRSERVRLFGIAADLCGVRHCRNRH